MKRLSFFMVIVLLLSITACDFNRISGNSDKLTDNKNQTARCTHVWNPATCTSPKKCSECDETEGMPLGHTTDSGVCSRCDKNFTEWEIGEYEDEFKEPTGEKYIIVESYGTFSNSATTDSELYALLQVDKEDIGIMLWEYESQLVKGIFDYEDYYIAILDEAGKKHYFTGTMYEGSTRVYFDESDRNAVLNLLHKNNTLKIYLESTDYSASTYLFVIDATGFSEMYKLIK